MDQDQLLFLLRLLDDDSPCVQAEVRDALLRLGPLDVARVIAASDGLTPSIRGRVANLVREFRQAEAIGRAWERWRRIDDRYQQLERGHELLARMQYGWTPPVRLDELLDELADEYLEAGGMPDPISLSRFLFIVKDFRGENDDYFNPLYSNLIHTLQTGFGLPISLCCTYMLVGQRLGIDIGGCAMPAYFLCRAVYKSETVFIDCYNAGRVLTRTEVVRAGGPLPVQLQAVLDRDATPHQVLARVVNNLVYAYTLRGDAVQAAHFSQLTPRVFEAPVALPAPAHG